MNKQDEQEVQAVFLSKNGSRQWVVECPYCGEPHHHGAGGKSDNPLGFLGHRLAHCGKGGYNMTDSGIWIAE